MRDRYARLLQRAPNLLADQIRARKNSAVAIPRLLALLQPLELRHDEIELSLRVFARDDRDRRAALAALANRLHLTLAIRSDDCRRRAHNL